MASKFQWPEIKINFTWPDNKAGLAWAIVGIFAYAYHRDPNETMQGALLMAFAAAWGYYLGSSKGANDANARVDKALDKIPEGDKK